MAPQSPLFPPLDTPRIRGAFGLCGAVTLLDSTGTGSAPGHWVRTQSARLAAVRDVFDFDAGTSRNTQGAAPGQDVIDDPDGLAAFYPLGAPVFGTGAHSERILDELVGIADAQGQCLLAHGEVISGSLSLGWWRKNDGRVESDGLVRAKALQMHRRAPVLVIDERLFAHVRAHSALRNYGVDVDPVHTLFRRFEGTLRGRRVSFCHLDYIRICLEGVDWADTPERIEAYRAAPIGEARQAILEEGYRERVREWLLAHAASIVFAHHHAGSDARDALEWLAGYHNAVVTAVVADPVCLCVLDPDSPQPTVQQGRTQL